MATISSNSGSTSSLSPFTLSGLNGFDFSSIIAATIQSDSAPMNALQAQQATIQARDSALSTLGSQISQLETTVSSLGSQTSFTNVTATPSDPTIATVSTGNGAIAGTYNLNIANLAAAQVTASTNGYTNTTDKAADGGTISFTIGGTTTTPISVTSATSLADLANQINSQNSGVFAAVVNDGTKNRLAVMSRQTGTSNGFTINNNLTNSSGTVLAFAANQSPTTGNSQNALNASFTLNGISISSGSNTVSNAIPGVTISLLKGGQTTVNVTPDYTSVQNTLSTLVSQYNSLRQYVASQSSASNGQSGPLANDPVVRQIMNDMTSQLLASGGGQFQYLSNVGIQFNRDGSLSFNQATFQGAISSSATDVKTLFQGTNNNGIFNNLLSQLQSEDSTAGLIFNTTASDRSTINSLSSEIADQQAALNLERTQLTQMYSAADQAMLQLRSESQSLSQFGTQSLF
jgi:flagellar hook-associated protein 2